MPSRSSPVQKALSPAPVSTTQRTSSFFRSIIQSSRSSRCMVVSKAFSASGRFSVTQATPSDSS